MVGFLIERLFRPYERFAAVTFEVPHGFLEGLESLMEKTNGKDSLRRLGCPCGHNRGRPGRGGV